LLNLHYRNRNYEHDYKLVHVKLKFKKVKVTGNKSEGYENIDGQNLRNDHTVKLPNVIFSFYNSNVNIYKDKFLPQLEAATEEGNLRYELTTPSSLLLISSFTFRV
jgi:hypothetical protein